jgi:glycosyltransferase involved in cell wall biosynthesis
MEGLMIKIQKARRMIKKNGLKSGGKIVAGYAKDYLKSLTVGSGDILFITGGIGDKAHFRAFGVAEELELHGFQCAVTVSGNPSLLKYANRFKIFIFQKVSFSEKIAKLIAELKKQQREIIFDTDDLDFDPKYFSDADYFSQITEAEKKEYGKGMGAEILNDPYVKICTTTVSYLADKLREKNKRVFIVSNKISNRELEIAEKVSVSKVHKVGKSIKPDDCIRIGYFSGTLSHNKDFATITEPLIAILKKYPNVKLLLAGLLETENKLNEFKNRIEILPRVPRDEYYANVYKCDINIVPLEIGNPFCESRSELKFFEAGVLGIPTVAVKNRTYSEAIEDGVDGFLADNFAQWEEKLGRLIEGENLRKTMGEKARQKVLCDYTTKNSHSEEYYGYLREVLKQDKNSD